MKTETIVALATPMGEAGLAVVRLSGPEALGVAGKVFSGGGFPGTAQSHRAVYGILSWPTDNGSMGYLKGDPVDQVLALPLLAPHGYTGENTVEFFCHGGRLVSGAVVAACVAAGAVPATSGEFTRRAFLNGKLSLDQAEAVADLIHAESPAAAGAAVRQLLGGMSSQLAELERPLIDLLARIEGSLEFAEEEEISVPQAQVSQQLSLADNRIGNLLDMAPAGRMLRDGIHVVLAGSPNVGKSSLFNALLEDDRAIVDDEAGTTRDVVSARTTRHGNVYVFHDTAGLRDEAGRVEQMGIERTWRKMEDADIVLSLNEAADVDAAFLTAEVFSEALDAPPIIRVFTKCDAWNRTQEVDPPQGDAILTSSKTHVGLDQVWRALEDAVEQFRLREAAHLGVVLNERHRLKLQRCREELHLLQATLSEPDAPGDEVIGTLLASILSGLGEISGRVFTENLLETVFSRFCVGK